MIIFPAIDIKDGNCVRLYKGDFDTVHKVADSPLETAKVFEQAGAEWVHMVDLDGAKDGLPKNSEIFINVAKNTSLKVELGGGIRNMDIVDYYIKNGISRVIIGSAAIKNPDFAKEAIAKYGDKIAIGIDAKNGYVATEGWIEKSNVTYIGLARKMESFGAKYIIYTDISKDGMLAGPNTEQLVELSKNVSCNITASGGIKDIKDIAELKAANMYGAICGKSIYSKTLDLKAAIRLTKGEE